MKPQDIVSSWLRGRASVAGDRVTLGSARTAALGDKLRRAYDWIAREAIVGPYHDVELGDAASVGRSSVQVELRAESYSSYILLPLLNLATSQRLLFIGAPGRGKTSMAIIMGLLAGNSLTEVKRGVQRGHPQLTISDLLGSPLPSEMIRAEDLKSIHVSWRKWLTNRVKIIDEYNRIPTKTQSALLSLMAEGYAEQFEQVVECGWSAWFLTANDDFGGGTFPVIEALKDRIDIVVRCTPFNAHHLDALVRRVGEARRPIELVPSEIVFTAAELDELEREIRGVPFPESVRNVLGFFAGQLEFCQRASDKLEYMNKDTLHLAGRKVAHVCNEDCPLDKQINLCTQTESGVSARAYQTLILFSKALAYFRGGSTVTLDDVRQILPWVLHEKLKLNPQSPFFQKTANQVLTTDRVSWIRRMFDDALKQHSAYAKVRFPIEELKAEANAGASGLNKAELEKRLRGIQQTIDGVLRTNELSGPIYEDLLLLKSLHCQYRGRLNDLERTVSGAS